MGYTTDFVGHIRIDPPLNKSEQQYLAAFAASRRMERRDGPYAMGNEEREVVDGNAPPPGQPGLWCQWIPSCCGRCLVWDRGEKFYAPTEWMRYVIDHLLRPGAFAARTGLPEFDKFTFDHTVSGEVAACRADTGRLWLIIVGDNDVREEVRVPGVPTDLVWAPFGDYTQPAPAGPGFEPA